MLGNNTLNLNRFLILPIAIGITQFIGLNTLSIFLLILGGLTIISNKIHPLSTKNNLFLPLFLINCLLAGIFDIYNTTPSILSLIVWCQFFFLAMLPLFVSNKEELFLYLKYIVLFIFLLDVTTNILLLVGFHLPWVSMTNARPNESLARFPGIKGNNLFSSLFSFLTFSIMLDKKQFSSKYGRIVILMLAILNLLLAGARRSIILALASFFLFMIHKIRTSKYFILFFFLMLAATIIVLDIYTMESNPANLLRYELWINSIVNIIEKPYIGYGFFYPDLNNITATFSELSNVGVTESFLLSIAYCFGIPALLWFVFFEFKTLMISTLINEYTAYIGIFFGLSIELFFGGSLENTMAGLLFFLSHLL